MFVYLVGTDRAPNGPCSQADHQAAPNTLLATALYETFTDFCLPHPSKLELFEGRHCWIPPHGHSTVLVEGRGILSNGTGVAALSALYAHKQQTSEEVKSLMRKGMELAVSTLYLTC